MMRCLAAAVCVLVLGAAAGAVLWIIAWDTATRGGSW